MKNLRIFVVLAVALCLIGTIFVACTKQPAASTATPTTAAAASTATPTTAAAASTSPSAKNKVTIGIIPLTLSHVVHGNAAKWAEQYAKEKYGADVTLIDPHSSMQEEVAAVETMIAKGVTGICMMAVNETGANDVIQEARKAGVYVVTYIIDASDMTTPFVHVNEIAATTKMGVNMAKQWKELYPDKPIAVGFVDFFSMQYTLVNRSQPFLAGVESVDSSVKAPVFWLAAEGDQDVSKQIGQAVLQSHPEVNIIYGTNTPSAMGILSAFEEAGRGKAVDGKPLTEIFAGTDGNEQELKKLANPNSSFKYTQGMQPKDQGTAYIDTMMKIINGEIKPDGHYQVEVNNIYLDGYMPYKDYEDWYNTQYNPETKLDLKAELAKEGVTLK